VPYPFPLGNGDRQRSVVTRKGGKNHKKNAKRAVGGSRDRFGRKIVPSKNGIALDMELQKKIKRKSLLKRESAYQAKSQGTRRKQRNTEKK